MMTVKEFAQRYNLTWGTCVLTNNQTGAKVETSHIAGLDVKNEQEEYTASIIEYLGPDDQVKAMVYRGVHRHNRMFREFNPEDDAQAQEAISAIFDRPYPFRPEPHREEETK